MEKHATSPQESANSIEDEWVFESYDDSSEEKYNSKYNSMPPLKKGSMRIHFKSKAIKKKKKEDKKEDKKNNKN